MRKKFILLSLTLSLLMVSCLSGNFLPDKPTPARTLEINNEYEVIWSLPNMYVDDCSQNPLMVSIPDIIFVEKSNTWQESRSVLAINSLDGKTLWQIEPPSLYNGILLARDKVLYRAIYGVAAVQAYNIADGKLLWQTSLTGGHSSIDLYFADNKIFVSTSDNEFFILSDQGEILEHRIMQADVYGEMNGVMYVQDNAFRAIEIASGRELWQVVVDRFKFRSSPIFDKEAIFLRTADIKGSIYSLDQGTGKVNWKVSQKMYSNLYLTGEKIYFISSDGYLVTIDRNSGAELSKVRFSSFPSELSTGLDYCITGDAANNVLAVSFSDNNQILGIRIKNP